MSHFSENENLVIGDNYTRGMLCDLMNIKYCADEIEKGIYKPGKYSSVLIFSTINNYWKYYNRKALDNEFIFSGNGKYKDQALLTHQIMNNELLLFIRMDEESGFYYFGRCKYINDYELEGYHLPLYGLELLDTKFSSIKSINVP